MPNAAKPAALEICSTPSMQCATTDLGAITAQFAPTIALTDGGLLLIGVQKPENKLLGIDVADGSIVIDRAMPLVQNFISSIAASGFVAALSDFGVFGQGGAALFANVDPAGWSGVPVTPLQGSAGPSTIVGTKLYQAVTANDGMSGSVWSLDVANMQ